MIRAITSPADPWLVVADLRSLIDAQQRVAEIYRDQERWTRMGILNTAASGGFSADRAVEEYNLEIWKLERVGVSPVD